MIKQVVILDPRLTSQAEVGPGFYVANLDKVLLFSLLEIIIWVNIFVTNIDKNRKWNEAIEFSVTVEHYQVRK